VELRLEYGADFELAPDRAWARKILSHPALPGHVKLAVIREKLAASTGGRRIKPAPGKGKPVPCHSVSSAAAL
jgi:hypothetical protein